MSRRLLVTVLLIAVAMGATGFALRVLNSGTSAPVRSLRIIREYPHDPAAFTQGLVIRDGILHESTGIYGASTLRRVDLPTGNVRTLVPLSPQVFGEGMTVLGEEVFVLTWQSRIGYVFDRTTLQFKRSFRYGGEGWGLTDDGRQLILSDGTPTLRYLDPATGAVTKRLAVSDAGQPVKHLNELEFIDGEIWANIWYSDRIACINPATGAVTSWIDAAPLRKRVTLGNPKEDVLNGIAHDATANRLFLTGKHWPKLFEVELTE